MKISDMNIARHAVGVLALSAGIMFCTPAKIQASLPYDRFERTSVVSVPATGTISREILAQAPSPVLIMQGERKFATVVVDITKNILYKYDKHGNPEIAYLIASGKPSTPTAVGVRVVSHVEAFPYRSAPARTNRRKSPSSFGPNIIIMDMIDLRTGIKWNNGEYIHGNNDPTSIGKHISHGCIRMDNSVITQLSKQVKRGDFVIVIR